MASRLAVVVVLLCCCWHTGTTVATTEDAPETCGVDPTADAGDGSRPGPRLVSLYPNPVADGDAGEFVSVELPRGNHSEPLVLDDGETAVDLPGNLTSGTWTLTTDPERVASLGRENVSRLPSALSMANGGESVRLLAGGDPVDCIGFEDAPEGAVLDAGGTDTGARWRPLGATDFDVAEAGPGQVHAFVLPDAPAVPLETLRGADRRLLLAAYTLTSRRVEAALLAAERRGVRVRVLVDREPVGGMSERQVRLLDNLTEAGVEVRALGGAGARYEFHHAKYAVADDRALVTTENWKPAGTGGHSSRGWGAVTTQPAAVERLVAVFRADAGARDATPWAAVRDSVDGTETTPATAAFPADVDPDRLRVDGGRVLVAPDNAETGVVRALDDATESVSVIQLRVGGRSQPFVRALVRAARRGVRVRLLLSSAWYVEAENRHVVAELDRLATRESLPIDARLAEPRGRFEKVHAKGVVIDRERVVLGSLNWNNHSARENREVALLLEGDAVGRFFGRAFDADWSDGTGPVPIGLLVVAAGAILLALWRTRTVSFDGGRRREQSPAAPHRRARGSKTLLPAAGDSGNVEGRGQKAYRDRLTGGGNGRRRRGDRPEPTGTARNRRRGTRSGGAGSGPDRGQRDRRRGR